jgi:hypothetical protein
VATWVWDIPNWDEFDIVDFLISLIPARAREIVERLLPFKTSTAPWSAD